MNTEKKNAQAPISEQQIFNVMLYITFPVAGIFLIKNILGKNISGALTVGIVLALFGGALFFMHRAKVSAKLEQLVASIGLAFVVFIISLNSGSYYSDDFPLYLAVIAMTGLYLRPTYALAQMVICDILLVLQYIIHPEKAESLSQFIMCTAIFTLATYLIYLTLKRGRAYISISQTRAEEAEKLLNSLTQLGAELEHNFETSSNSIETLRQTRKRLDGSTGQLKQDSAEIMLGAQEVSSTCADVREKVHATEKQVSELTDGVRNVEAALAANQQNIEEMNQQILSVQKATRQVNAVFALLEEHMQEISAVTNQLNSISSSTTMLALNASIEAARAGQSGAGFAVVASKVQDLAVDSNSCSGQVVSVVNQMKEQIQETTRQLAENDQVINTSLEALKDLQDGFTQLTAQFDTLYQNIEAQNSNVTQVDTIFETLHEKIAQVSRYCEENQSSVEDISEAILVYKSGVEKIVDDSKRVRDLSSDMLDISREA